MRPARNEFRDRRSYALATLSELAAPLLRGGARVVVGASAAPPAAWRRGLILGNAHIGDVLYRTGSLDQLSRGLPGCQWSYLCTPFAADVLHGNPAIADVLPWMTDTEPASALSGHGAELRRLHFDVALCTENVRTHTGLLTAVACRIANRVAFTQRGLSGLATFRVRLEHAVPRPEQIQIMVSAVTGTDAAAEPRPRVYPAADDVCAAAAEWARVGAADSSHLFACSVTARQSVGVYPLELFAAILGRVLSRAPRARIVLLGSDADKAVLTELANRLGPRSVVSAGRLGLRAVVAFLARCDAFLGSDSGPRHLGNAAGIPVFFIRNLGTSEIETGAYVSTEHDLAPHGEYLSPSGARRLLGTVDADAAAARMLATVSRARDTHADTPR